MSFVQTEIAFQPGLFANRSRRASKQRWTDGNLVRFADGVPAQIGGWQVQPTTGVTLTGFARAIISWRPNSQAGRFAAIGTDTGAFLYDGETLSDITPTGFVPGSGTSIIGDGYGSDRFGSGDYGTPRASTGNIIDASVWTFDMFGETLIGCFSTDGLIYTFTESDDARLSPILTAPHARAICVSDERHLFAFGIDGNPGKVAWSDRENYSVWDPSATNRAGSYDLQITSAFQCGKRVRGAILGWTKTEVFAFTPLNNALVYSRDRISTEAGAVGPNAVTVVTDNSGETAYWIGRDNFFVYEGYVRVLPCELHDYVFKDFNELQGAKAHARVNTAFDEIWFWYCSALSDEVDRCVVYCFRTDTWTKALVPRLCWLDAGVFPKPLAISAAGVMYQHETGVTAAGGVMPSFVTSFPLMIANGQQLAEVDQFWPDMEEDSAACTVSFITRSSPGSDPVLFGPYPFVVGTEFVPLTIAAREMQLRIDGAGGYWELGVPLLSMQGGSLR